MSEYQLEYDGNQRDTTRVDARQVRLRVFRDLQYFQFVVAVAPGPDLVLLKALEKHRPGRFWKAFVLEAVPDIKDAIQRREIPLKDPTKSYEVFPSVGRAIDRATTVNGEAEVGKVIAKFRLD